MGTTHYKGRFAPSPTGPLHAGSLVAALASWLDAKAHGGQWLVRIEDIDTPRCVAGAADHILRQLAALGLLPDEPPVFQSQRSALYQVALDHLIKAGDAYPCGCSRKDIEMAMLTNGQPKSSHGELVYPGTCRPERGGLQRKQARGWRFHTEFFCKNNPTTPYFNAQAAIELIAKKSNFSNNLQWNDQRLGPQQQDVAAEVGDFILKRADGLWAYQLAVVVDDAAQGITHVVRGEDLLGNTARQILLQFALGYPTPRYTHTPLVLAADGYKLSKQNGAQALNVNEPVRCLQQAAQTLGIYVESCSVGDFFSQALNQYARSLADN